MDPLQKRAIRQTGVSVTQLGFGCAPLGGAVAALDDETAWQTIETAWNLGLRYYDTSPWYGYGHSEHRTGRFLRTRPRDEYILSTKVGHLLGAPRAGETPRPPLWRGGLPFHPRFDYTYDGIMRSFEDSMQRMGLISIDMLLIHDLNLKNHGSVAKTTAYLYELATSGWRALEQLKSTGLIKAIGAGINETDQISTFLDVVDLDFFMVSARYSLMQQHGLEKDVPLCEKKGIGLVIATPLGSGIFATGAVQGARYNYTPAGNDLLDKVRRMQAICARHGVSLPAAALQFPFGHPCTVSVIPGAEKAGMVLENVASFSETIPADLWAEFKQEGLIDPDAPTP